jgi:hypothetical protein
MRRFGCVVRNVNRGRRVGDGLIEATQDNQTTVGAVDHEGSCPAFHS